MIYCYLTLNNLTALKTHRLGGHTLWDHHRYDGGEFQVIISFKAVC